LIGMEFTRLHPQEDAELHRQTFQHNVENSSGVNFESEVLHRDGRRIPVIINAKPHMIEGRKLMMAFFLDITERKRAENALRRSQYILAKSQEIAHVGNWAWNVQTDTITGSDEIFHLFGHPELGGQADLSLFISLIHPDDKKVMEEIIEKMASDGITVQHDYRIVRPDGHVRNMTLISDKIVRDRDGSVKLVYGIQQDITGRKQAEKAIEDAKAQADLYLDIMGHDINNLNQIGIGFLEMALETFWHSKQETMLLNTSLEAFMASSKLIENLRKLQKIRTQEMHHYEVDISHILEKVRDEYSEAPSKKLKIDYQPLEGSTVMANEMLCDLFSNLVGNAIKHTTNDPVISLRLERLCDRDKSWYRVSVEDNGPGIPDALKEKIFNRHLRGGTTANGSGIGLYLVKTLAHDYHGHVWVEDRIQGAPSKGSKFVVLLPAIERLMD
ncbi:MAG TPA: PAS domain S-box protein, partial [Methanocella sp.]|nr:PAS domain S-box protein [Methanocella sp.]